MDVREGTADDRTKCLSVAKSFVNGYLVPLLWDPVINNATPDMESLDNGPSDVQRSTAIAGAREVGNLPQRLMSFEEIRVNNKLVVKFSWPEETRISEAEFVRRAETIGESNPPVRVTYPRC